jgi:hypothetical protein
VLRSPTQERAPPIVTHAASQSPTCSLATRTWRWGGRCEDSCGGCFLSVCSLECLIAV